MQHNLYIQQEPDDLATICSCGCKRKAFVTLSTLISQSAMSHWNVGPTLPVLTTDDNHQDNYQKFPLNKLVLPEIILLFDL